MVDSLEMSSHFDEECLLDVPFTMEDISRAINKLKSKKAPGPDGLMAEHLKARGEAIVIWLMRVLNAVVELEAIPGLLKRGVTVPIYKGGGKDPLRTDTHLRGVQGS